MANSRTRFARASYPSAPLLKAMRALLDEVDPMETEIVRWEMDQAAMKLLLLSPGNDGGLNAEATAVHNVTIRLRPAGELPEQAGLRLRLITCPREPVGHQLIYRARALQPAPADRAQDAVCDDREQESGKLCTR